MCGIAGILTYSENIPDPALLHRMANTIVHRGPDAEGIYVGPHVGLAQRRLSIIDPDQQTALDGMKPRRQHVSA